MNSSSEPLLAGESWNSSAQAYQADARNESVLVYLNGEFVARRDAMVSVLDSGFVLGDGVWEGLRLVEGRVLSLDAHLTRLYEGARSIALEIGMERADLARAIAATFEQNKMFDGAHMRLMVTRGPKRTANQDPRFAMGRATVVMVAEYKVVTPQAKSRGLTLLTSAFRTSTPDVFDLRLNSHSRLNLVQALIQAINCGADEALMLDPRGFVASCNSTNFFLVRDGELWTSTGAYSFKGITQRNVIEAWLNAGGRVHEKDFTLAEVYSADEAFVTGTLGGVTSVRKVDGRTIGNPNSLFEQTARASQLYIAYALNNSPLLVERHQRA